jgi:hypothetical protein
MDAAIDGTNTAYVSVQSIKLKAKGKELQNKEVKGLIELDGGSVDRVEQSAEKDDPKGREIPSVEFAPDKTAWKPFTSKEGRFTADYPGTPTVESKKNAAAGDVITQVVLATKDGSVAYLVTFTDFTKDLSKVDPKLLLVKVAGPGTKDLKSRKEITLNGFPGVEFVLQPEKYIITHRCYMVNGRLYQAIVNIKKGKERGAEQERFFKSFRLMEKAP